MITYTANQIGKLLILWHIITVMCILYMMVVEGFYLVFLFTFVEVFILKNLIEDQINNPTNFNKKFVVKLVNEEL